ncbi:hypothetical protein D6833_11490 [Candidatus Parcubacteria bacterium]|nr:MAG: hypothetical protein D6833_11490 [Candidatus Parcubacteria bacterium]
MSPGPGRRTWSQGGPRSRPPAAKTPSLGAIRVKIGGGSECVAALNREGARAFDGGKYDVARGLVEKGSQMIAFRERAKDLKKEWLSIVADVPPSEPRDRKGSRHKKLPPGLRTPEGEYRIPILQALVDLGGTAPVNEVLEKVETLMKHKLNAYDRQTLPSDPINPRWRNTAKWVQAAMVKEGLLSSCSPRGVWEITDSGRRFLEQHK